MAHRLEKEKQTEVGLRAWVASGLGNQGWTLVVFGEGDEAERLRDLTHDPSVIWAGWTENLYEELLGAAALLATAPAEPLGLTVLEAMSIGLPVVAALGGGHAETIGAVAGALTFEPGDVTDCKHRLIESATMSPIEKRKLGERLRAAQRATWIDDNRTLDVTSYYHVGFCGVTSCRYA